MSVIVWDGTTLAADTQCTHQNMKRTMSKIFRHGDKLVAGVGDVRSVSAVRSWLDAGMDPAKFPVLGDDDSSTVWVISKDGLLQFERSPHPLVFADTKLADGSGRDYAMGAMAMGANAIKAVEVACQFDVYCGGEVEWMRLDD